MIKKNVFRYTMIVSLCLLASIFTASAQFKFGVKAGVDVAENKLDKNTLNAHNRLGFQIGPTVNFNIPLTGLGFESGLLFGHKDYTVKEKQKGNVSNYNYLMLPVNLKQSFSVLGILGVYGKAGAYGEFKLNGGDIKYLESKVKSKDIGIGLNFGVGVNLLSKLDLGLDYRFKLSDNYKDVSVGDALNIKKDKTWNVYLTYYL